MGANVPAVEPSIAAGVQTFQSSVDNALDPLQPLLLVVPPKEAPRVAKAEARSTKAAAKSAAATARANALQHGTGDAVITQPAPSAPSTTASASGATPATPASTTIR